MEGGGREKRTKIKPIPNENSFPIIARKAKKENTSNTIKRTRIPKSVLKVIYNMIIDSTIMIHSHTSNGVGVLYSSIISLQKNKRKNPRDNTSSITIEMIVIFIENTILVK